MVFKYLQVLSYVQIVIKKLQVSSLDSSQILQVTFLDSPRNR
jgi:hypothetical protein